MSLRDDVKQYNLSKHFIHQNNIVQYNMMHYKTIFNHNPNKLQEIPLELDMGQSYNFREPDCLLFLLT